MNNGIEGLENLKELEKLELIINKIKQLITEQESEIETLKKEIALVREDGQIEILRLNKLLTEAIFTREQRIRELEQINKEHQDQNGKLQKRLFQYEDKAAHYRRKAVL